MVKFVQSSEITFKEVITTIEAVDLTGDGHDNLVISTINGDMRVLDIEFGEKTRASEITRIEGLPPVAVIGMGDVTGSGTSDFVVGGLDNILRVISFVDNELVVIATSSLGTLPTAVCVTNVTDGPNAEVIVATNDKALRCYGWFDSILDKLAHKVIDMPTLSMQPLTSIGSPYSRFVFGDESANLYIYQYADDRLHEIGKLKTKGEVSIVATGNMSGDRNDEIVTITDDKTITLFGLIQRGIEEYDSLRAPGHITSARVGSLLKGSNQEGQLLISLADSTLSMFSLDGRRLVHEGTTKTAQKAAESLAVYGDLNGNGVTDIVQSVGNTVNLISVQDD